MKVVIFGAQGRLGQELTYKLEHNYEVIPLSRFNVDIRDTGAVHTLLDSLSADYIINTAAITYCSSNPNTKEQEAIFQSNTAGALGIAAFCKETHTPFIYISCASALAGSKDKSPQAEQKAIEIIGQSKLEAEKMIQDIFEENDKYCIIRTGILFGQYGHSFLQNIARHLTKKKAIEVVDDMFFSFTSTRALTEFIEIQLSQKETFKEKIIHYCHPEIWSPKNIAEYFAKNMKKDINIINISAKDISEKSGDFSLQSSEKLKSITEYL